MKPVLSAEVLEEAQQMGLNPHRLSVHHRRIVAQLEAHQEESVSFPMVVPCRLDNGRIFSLETVAPAFSKTDLSHIVAMVLAAGASTRYFQSYGDLQVALWTQDLLCLQKEAYRLLTADVALTSPLRGALTDIVQEEVPSRQAMDNLQAALSLPKALQAFSSSGTTFLAHKIEAHASFSFLQGQVFVIPPGFLQDFERAPPPVTSPPILWETQDASLSTLRFDPKTGEPWREARGALSPVPAGHGVLLEKFAAIRQRFAEVKSVWIHNIDNTATGDLSVAVPFLQTHEAVRASMVQLRLYAVQGDFAAASAEAAALQARFPVRELASHEQAFVQNQDTEVQALWRFLFQVFQLPISIARSQPLAVLLARPVNLLGVVRNLGTDIGGAPVVVRTPQGEVAVCLELPHIADESRADFSDPAQVTHFNPVYLCAEWVDPRMYRGEEHPYWLLARKTWQGHPVCYHETLLSELVGNAELANVIFLEVPRRIFCPHKAIEETKGK